MMNYNKLIWSLCSIITVLFISACPGTFNMPEKVKITGSPTLAVPLGGPDFNMDDYLSIKSIQDMIQGDEEGAGLAVYDYAGAEGANPTQIFLIHYKIDPIEFNISPDALNFNGMQEEIDMKDASFSITIPEIKPEPRPEIVIPIPDPIKGSVSNAQDTEEFPIPLPGDLDPISLNLAGAGFYRAKIGTGKLVFGNEGENPNFSEVSFTLTGGSIPDQQINGQDRTCPLDGKTIFEDTKISLTGTIKAPAGMLKNKTELRIPIDVEITRFSEIAIASSEKISVEIPVELNDMGEWVESVKFKKLEITLKITPRIDGMTVKFNAPVFDIDTKHDNNIQTSDETTFKNGMTFGPDVEKYSLEPATADSDITIDVGPPQDEESAILTLYDVAPGDPIELAVAIEQPLVFEWTEAEVYPNALLEGEDAPKFDGTFPAEEFGFDLSQFTESLKDMMEPGEIDKIEFDKVTLHLYVTGADDLVENISICLDAQYPPDIKKYLTENEDDPDNNYVPLKKMSKPLGNPLAGAYSEALPEASFDADLAGVFNDKPKDLFLNYKLQLPDKMTIHRDGGDLNLTLKPDLIIELPLKFKIAADGKDYAQLDLSKLIPQTSGDLLGRTGPNDSLDENFEYVDYVSLNVNYTNTIGLSDTLIVLTVRDAAAAEETDSKVRFSKPLLRLRDGGPYDSLLQLQVEDLKYPFKPEIEIKIPAQNGYGSLEIKRGKTLKLAITVSVKARIDQEIEL
ncbi:MAG: hypothetical protein LBT13_07680 [Treponema sp.]|jgi:hypothetical protein|nr:hypothetical protein [Treponema sp.]